MQKNYAKERKKTAFKCYKIASKPQEKRYSNN